MEWDTILGFLHDLTTNNTVAAWAKTNREQGALSKICCTTTSGCGKAITPPDDSDILLVKNEVLLKPTLIRSRTRGSIVRFSSRVYYKGF